MASRNGWGLIGTGRIAEDRILPGITACAGNRLVAVVSRDAQRAEAFAKKFGAQHAYTNYEEMLRNPDVTVVAIHTPNSLHAEQAIAAARAGKHVFCDKPMTLSFANGTMAQVNVNEKAKYPYNDFIIHGTRGRITGKGLTRSRAGGALQVLAADGTERSVDYPANNAHAACVAGFSKALLEGVQPSPSGIDGLRSVQLTDAMGRSAWDGVHVRLAS